jgi:hypothetical protein
MAGAGPAMTKATHIQAIGKRPATLGALSVNQLSGGK